MKKTLRIVFALSMGVLGGALIAQTEADFSGWMKEIQPTSGKMKGAVAAKDAAAVTAGMKILENDFKAVETFFTKKGTADAAGMAKAAHTAATATIAAVTAGNWDEAAKQQAIVGGSCGGCHAAHREGEKGGPYKIK